jgi:hypothetical protein
MEKLHVGHAETNFFRGLRVEQNARGKELADFEYYAVGGSDRRR